MSWAALISRAIAGLASNVCGSVLGLDMMALTCTYWPPTWLITSAYSFSAPTATILPPGSDPAALAPIEHADRAVAVTAAPAGAARCAPGVAVRAARLTIRSLTAPLRMPCSSMIALPYVRNDNRFQYH